MILDILGIGSELQGVGRTADGQVVFVPFALPGERVEVEITRTADRFKEGRIVRIVEPAPQRVTPVCPLYGRCGGCRTQHMTYQRSLELKTRVVEQQLERIGGLEKPKVLPAIGSDRPWRYRNKAEFFVSTDPETRTPVIGVRALAGAAVLPVGDCMIQSDIAVKALQTVTRWMQIYCIPAWDDRASQEGGVRYVVTRVNHAGELMLIVCSTSRALRKLDQLYEMLHAEFAGFRSLNHIVLEKRPRHALDGRLESFRGRRALYDQLMGLSFEMSPKTFFQVNHAQTEKLYECVRQAAALTGGELVVDAYCGCGTISLVLAREAAHVIGVEIVEAAVENARLNAKRNKLEEKTEFFAGDAGRLVSDMLRNRVCPDVLVVDPPRKGVDASLIDAIIQAKVPRLVYVSCNPGTLARDVKRLTREGGYKMEYAQPVDMFSQTEHVETVVLMSRIQT
ncbi:MAG: 23S rRNA (uracil(1939)-C(5))-methyltransferase RlmD [Clostridia bacterium]|nr:23S rRNA (uracil(1939)-C(5))-methyltransferase RlmD [Clostridia bacterium]